MATVDEMIRLMEAMAQHRVGLVEYEGVKMMLAPPDRVPASAASGIAPTNQAQAAANQANVQPQQAFQAIDLARKRAQIDAQQKLAASQSRTARAREKAAGGIGGGLGKAVEKLYEDSKKVPLPAPVVEAPVQESAPENEDA